MHWVVNANIRSNIRSNASDNGINQPMTDLPLFLGINKEDKVEQLSMN